MIGCFFLTQVDKLLNAPHILPYLPFYHGYIFNHDHVSYNGYMSYHGYIFTMVTFFNMAMFFTMATSYHSYLINMSPFSP